MVRRACLLGLKRMRYLRILSNHRARCDIVDISVCGDGFFAVNHRASSPTSAESMPSSQWEPGSTGGTQTKTIIDDGEQHTVFLDNLEVRYGHQGLLEVFGWKGARTTIIHGQGVQAFQTAGELKLEAMGSENQGVKFGYVLPRLQKAIAKCERASADVVGNPVICRGCLD